MGIDIGGSHISLGFVNDNNDLFDFEIESFRIDHTWQAQEAIDTICASIGKLSKKMDEVYSRWSLKAVGIGCPGQIKDGILVSASNLPNFKNVPLASMLSSRINNVTVVLLNDADAAFHAELMSSTNLSKYQNVKSACMISIGTGIGVSLYLNGVIHNGCNNLVEGGHMIIDFTQNGRLCGCGQV